MVMSQKKKSDGSIIRGFDTPRVQIIEPSDYRILGFSTYNRWADYTLGITRFLVHLCSDAC